MTLLYTSVCMAEHTRLTGGYYIVTLLHTCVHAPGVACVYYAPKFAYYAF